MQSANNPCVPTRLATALLNDDRRPVCLQSRLDNLSQSLSFAANARPRFFFRSLLDVKDGVINDSTFPNRGKSLLAGQTRLAPRIVTRRIGTPASKAILTAPPFIRTIEPSGSPRPPSGKITTTPLSRNHVRERRIAFGFPSI